MTNTSLCRLLGIPYPIQALIGSATSPSLAAAVSSAGGLGTLALSWRSVDSTRQVVRETFDLTDCPFAANLVLEWPQEERARVCLCEGVSALSTFWGNPTSYVQMAHDYDAVSIHSVGSVTEARMAADAGVDVIVAQGVEAGGHVRGTLRGEDLLHVVLDEI